MKYYVKFTETNGVKFGEQRTDLSFAISDVDETAVYDWNDGILRKYAYEGNNEHTRHGSNWNQVSHEFGTMIQDQVWRENLVKVLHSGDNLTVKFCEEHGLVVPDKFKNSPSKGFSAMLQNDEHKDKLVEELKNGDLDTIAFCKEQGINFPNRII